MLYRLHNLREGYRREDKVGDILLFITSTGHGIFSFINIDDLKRP